MALSRMRSDQRTWKYPSLAARSSVSRSVNGYNTLASRTTLVEAAIMRCQRGGSLELPVVSPSLLGEVAQVAKRHLPLGVPLLLEEQTATD